VLTKLDLQLSILKYFYPNEIFEHEYDLLNYYHNHDEFIIIHNLLNLSYLDEYIYGNTKDYLPNKRQSLLINIKNLTIVYTNSNLHSFYIYLDGMPSRNKYHESTVEHYLYELVLYYNIPHTLETDC
jgi:hypothetical protein